MYCSQITVIPSLIHDVVMERVPDSNSLGPTFHLSSPEHLSSPGQESEYAPTFPENSLEKLYGETLRRNFLAQW